MRKLCRVYICDVCKTVALPETAYDDVADCFVKRQPFGWYKFGKAHLCPTCERAFSKLRDDVSKLSKVAAKVPFLGD